MPNTTPLNGADFGFPPERNYIEPPAPPYLDYAAIALSRLTNQFENSPRLQALVAAMVAPIRVLEETAYDIKTKRWIDTAEGKQLDGAGYIVGETRLGRDDATYREAIKFRIFVNTSNATPRDLIRGLRFLTSPDNVQYIEQRPATAMLFTDGPKVSQQIQQVMQSLAPAAISNVPVMVSYARKDPFRFGRESPPGELFVNGDASYLTGNGSDIQVQVSSAASGARLGGIAIADLFVGDFMLDIAGPTLAIDSPNHNVMIESGYHLVGVYQ